MFKTENLIYADLISLINTAIDSFEIEGWDVCQLMQPVKFTNPKPSVYIKILQTSLRGTQFTRRKKIDKDFVSYQAYKEEISIQVSAYRSRLIEDSVATVSSKDILNFISSWFVSPTGLMKIRDKGYEIYNPSEIKSPVFKNDSENFNPLPSFNITFITEQNWNMPVNYISEYKLKTKGI